MPVFRFFFKTINQLGSMKIIGGMLLSLPFFLVLLFGSCRQKQNDDSTWQVYGGSKESTHFSSLAQIDTSNVNKLKVVWVHHTGDADTATHSQMQCNPIIIGKTLYATTPGLRLIALDAETGKQKWLFDPAQDRIIKSKQGYILNVNISRGVTYWEENGDERIFYCAGSYLFAVNAANGKLITDFGENGRVDLHKGLGVDATNMYVTATTPGIIYKDLYILGSRVNETADAAPGHIRAYDVRTGKLRWVFHTIPHPGEEAYQTWDDKNAWKHLGGANCWSGFTLDEKTGYLYAPTGSVSFDFYGGMRKGKDLFANSLLAIEAATGKLKWYYQVVHHDLWDKDLPAPPGFGYYP